VHHHRTHAGRSKLQLECQPRRDACQSQPSDYLPRYL